MKEKLKTIKENLLTQDNRITDQPLFLVQQKIIDWGFDSQYCDDYIWVDKEGNEACDEKSAQLEEDDEYCLGYEDVREGWEKVWIKPRWEFVQPFFTEKAARDYMEGNAHRLNEPRIYAETSYRNEEFQTVRKAIMEGYFEKD